jgi:hypothetical protein
LGFKKPNRFKVYYAEIPIATSALWMDSLRTTNLTGETARLLAGQYSDPVFGTVSAQSFFQFRPTIVSTVIPPTAEYDSLVLQLRFDFYSYGSGGETPQTFMVHEITEELFATDNYYSTSTIDIGRVALGTTTVPVNQEYFKKEFDDTDADSTVTIRIKLSNGFGQRLFEAINPEDVGYTDFNQFKSNFKGLAILPSNQSDKIVGFNHTDVNSFMTLYYHEGDQKKTINFGLSSGVTFSKVIADRSGTELAGLDNFFTEYHGPKAYLQAGTSIVSRMDFSKYFEYIDTIPNIIINSAELEIANVELSSTLPPPKSLAITLLRPNNRYKSFRVKQDTTDYLAFKNTLTLGDELKFFVAQDQGGIITFNYNASKNAYTGFPTLFFQRLFELKNTPYPFMALRPSDPQPGKSVNRLVFPKDGIKLKLYYTRPNIQE